MYSANLSHEMLTSYLAKLLRCGLLENSREGSKSAYMTTGKGREYLHHYFSMQTLVEQLEG
jgi:predicted transcriptional regulator